MFPSRFRVLGAVALVLVLGTSALGACSREEAPGDGAADTTIGAPGTSVAPDTTMAPTPDTTTTATDPSAPVESTPTEPDTNAFGQTEEQAAQFRSVYAQAYRAECQRIWASVGGGALADPDFPEDQYTVNDCLAELDESWGEFANDVDEARSLGVDDAQIAASDLADPLCSAANPTRCWSYGD
jgi:hypothetical protein